MAKTVLFIDGSTLVHISYDYLAAKYFEIERYNISAFYSSNRDFGHIFDLYSYCLIAEAI